MLAEATGLKSSVLAVPTSPFCFNSIPNVFNSAFLNDEVLKREMLVVNSQLLLAFHLKVNQALQKLFTTKKTLSKKNTYEVFELS